MNILLSYYQGISAWDHTNSNGYCFKSNSQGQLASMLTVGFTSLLPMTCNSRRVPIMESPSGRYSIGVQVSAALPSARQSRAADALSRSPRRRASLSHAVS